VSVQIWNFLDSQNERKSERKTVKREERSEGKKRRSETKCFVCRGDKQVEYKKGKRQTKHYYPYLIYLIVKG
jgi:hypothetical protein